MTRTVEGALMETVWSEWTRLTTGAVRRIRILADRAPDGRVETLLTQDEGSEPEALLASFVWSDSPSPVSPAEWRPTRRWPTLLLRLWEGGTLVAFSGGGARMDQPPAMLKQNLDGTWGEWISDPARLERPGFCVAAVNQTLAGSQGPDRSGPLSVASAFVLTVDHNIWQLREESPGGRWDSLQLYSATNKLVTMTAVTRFDGRVELVGVSPVDTVHRTFQEERGGRWLGRWLRLYGPTDRIRTVSAAVNAEGRLEVFGVTVDGQLRHTWELEPGGGWNGEWVEFPTDGRPVGDVRAVTRQDGRISLFHLSDDVPDSVLHTPTPSSATVRHIWQTTDQGHWNGAWTELPAPPHDLGVEAVVRNEHGTFDVFAVDDFGMLWRSRQLHA